MANDEDVLRYQRQMMIQEIGETGQKKLLHSGVFICGCGALGGAVADILVRAGVGAVRIIDPDYVQLTNLHRQFLFTEKDAELKRSKIEAGLDSLTAANSAVMIEGMIERLTEKNAESVIQKTFVSGQKVDLLIDGTDNFATRFLLNRIAVQYRIPYISAGVCGTTGQILTIIPNQTPCLACLIGNAENGNLDDDYSRSKNQTDKSDSLSPPFPVLPSIVQMIAALEASEAIKILSGNINAVSKNLISIDLWTNQYRSLNLSSLVQTEECPVCQRKMSR